MSTAPVPPVPATERVDAPLWRNLSFQLMWVSIAAAGFGDCVIELVAFPLLGGLAKGAPASSIQAGVYFWYFVPWLFFTGIGGWLADTLPRKWIMLTCDEARAVLMFLAFLLIPAGLHQSELANGIPVADDWKVFALLFGVGAFASMFSPSRGAIIPQLVSAPQLNAANAVLLSIGVVANLIGTVIGAELLKHTPVRLVVFLAFASFCVSGMFFMLMKPRRKVPAIEGPRVGEIARILQAASYLRRHRSVFTLVVLNACIWSVAMFTLPAMAALCKQVYGFEGDDLVSRKAYMSLMIGLGLLSGSGFTAWMNIRRETTIPILSLLPITGVALIALAASKSFWFGMTAALITGMAGGAATVMIQTLTQAITPNYILGRVCGVREILGTVASVAINFTIWQLPHLERFSPIFEHTDTMLIRLLYPLAVALMLLGFIGLFVQITRGPLVTRRANALWRINRFFTLIWHRLLFIGRHRVPKSGPVIIASNHSAAIDSFLIQAALPRMIRWFMVDTYHYRVLDFMWGAVRPIVMKAGERPTAKLRETVRLLEAGEIIGVFPEGGLQRDSREMKPFQPGVAMLAVRSGATIVPVYVEGTPKSRYVPVHLFRPSKSRVIFGEAYKPDASLNYEAIVEDLRRRIEALATDAR